MPDIPDLKDIDLYGDKSPDPPKRRARGVAKPAAEKRQRRTSTQAKIALAMVETHLAGVYGHMKLLEQSINTLKEQLG